MIHGLIDHIYHTKQKEHAGAAQAADNGAAAALQNHFASSPRQLNAAIPFPYDVKPA